MTLIPGDHLFIRTVDKFDFTPYVGSNFSITNLDELVSEYWNGYFLDLNHIKIWNKYFSMYIVEVEILEVKFSNEYIYKCVSVYH